MWQSRVEIEHYSVAYFDRINARSKRCSSHQGRSSYALDLSGVHVLQHLGRGDVVELRNGIMLPGTAMCDHPWIYNLVAGRNDSAVH